MAVMIGALLFVLGFLVAAAVFVRDNRRWTILAATAIVLLGFSALTIFSIGLGTAPLALILLGISLWKLARRRATR